MLIATAAGWAASVLLCALHVRTRRRLVLVARASHEVRGPLCAARLGLDTLAAEPSRVAAIDLELRRAGRALDDLTAAPSGGRAPERRELVDLAALAAAQAPVWRALCAAHGAGFGLEAPTPAATDSSPLATAPAPPAASSPLATDSSPLATAPAPPAASSRLATDSSPLATAPAPPAASSRLATDSSPLAPIGSTPSAAASSPLLATGSTALAAASAAVAATDSTLRAAVTAAPPHLALVPPLRGAADPPATAVFADPLRIAQAGANLVANAAEHGGGAVRVRVRALGGTVRLEVADDGPGLPAPVAVLAARSRRERRGHGLAVAAAIVAQHGGRLAAAPGSRVVLELPAAAPAAEPRRRAVAPPPIVA